MEPLDFFFSACVAFLNLSSRVAAPPVDSNTSVWSALRDFLFFFVSSEHTQCYTLAFFFIHEKEKKSRETSRERRPRLAGTWRRVLTGEGNFPNAQTPGLTWGSQRGQDTCAVLYLNSLQRASAFTGVHTSHLFISDFTGAFRYTQQQKSSGTSRSERKRHDRTLISVFLYGELFAQTSNVFTRINNQWFISCDIYSYYKWRVQRLQLMGVWSDWSWYSHLFFRLSRRLVVKVMPRKSVVQYKQFNCVINNQ